MSAKFLQTFSEENSDLQRQIGCMTGIFQVFDRHNLLGGRKKFNGHEHKRIPSENSIANASNSGADNAVSSPRLVLEKNLSKNTSENQRTSMESSRTSFSSSSCSSFSSVDCNKSSLQGPAFLDKTLKNSPKLKASEVDFRDVVKDSINKEPQSLTVKTAHKEELKQRGSPRTTHLSKSMDGSYVIGIDGKSMPIFDLNESFRVLMKLKEAPWTFTEIKEHLNHRFSYDGREITTNFLDSRENNKLASKLRELPRLSLDSRESSIRSSNSIAKDFDQSISGKERSFASSNARKESGSHRNAPSVVAKLMGLEAMPASCSNHEPLDVIKNYASKTSKDVKMLFDSPRNSRNDLIKQSAMNSMAISKPFFAAKTAIEPAPWKQRDKQQTETVYCEIEKRLKELEFDHANKDLRALKQILDAIHAKGLHESKKNEQQYSPKFATTRNDRKIGSSMARKPPLPASTKRDHTTNAYESPIVIMKPAKSVNQFDASTNSAIHLRGLSGLQRLRTGESMDRKEPGSSKQERRMNCKTEENGQKSRLRTELCSSKSQLSSRENHGGSEKSLNSVSPRLQQRKLEAERRTRTSVSSSDLSKNQTFSTNKQLSETISPRNKLRHRRTLSQHSDTSQRSESNMSSTSHLGVEHASAKTYFASSEEGLKLKSPPLGLDEETSNLAVAAVPAEQPSPISVLDTTLYQDDLPLGLRSANVCKGNQFPNSEKIREFDSEINQKKLENIENLLQKLNELNSADEGASNTDHIASLCDTQNADHRYISEILLASGLLMKDFRSALIDLMPFSRHPSVLPINPDLFLVLEQMKSNQAFKSADELASLRRDFDLEKLHRKLVFDAVNEILIQKLEPPCFSTLPPSWKSHESFPSGQKLLRELCSEIDNLHTETLKTEGFHDDGNKVDDEVLRRLLERNDCRRELSGIALEIERLIFKDMIDEVVCGEAASSKCKYSRRRRQLFAK